MSALFGPTALVVPFENLRMGDVESVGGKNASLGEMISQLPQGVRVPTGFATTAHAFRQFLAHDGLAERIRQRLATLDTEDVRALAEGLATECRGACVSPVGVELVGRAQHEHGRLDALVLGEDAGRLEHPRQAVICHGERPVGACAVALLNQL